MFNVGTCFCYCTFFFFFYLVRRRRRRKGTHWHQFLTNENGALISFPCCWLGFHELALHTKTGCHASWRMGPLFSAFIFSLSPLLHFSNISHLFNDYSNCRPWFSDFRKFWGPCNDFFFFGVTKKSIAKTTSENKRTGKKKRVKARGK